MVKIQRIYLFIRKSEVIMVLISKMITPGFALVIFGSACLAANDQTSILPDAIYNWIFIGLLGFGSILFIVGVCKSESS
jgi:hypothetical protein